jgi:hypothetical protein
MVNLGETDQLPGGAGVTINGKNQTFTQDQETILATALGTVCNSIFGTGNTTPDFSSFGAAPSASPAP